MPEILAIVRRRPAVAVVSAIGLATALGASLRLWAGPAQEAAVAPADPEVVAAATEPETFENASGSVSWRLESLSPQYLFPSTPKGERTAAIVVGRADPYSPIAIGGAAPRPQAATVAAPPLPTSLPPSATTLPPAIAVAPTGLPPIPTNFQPLAPLPAPPSATTLPGIAAAPAAYASPIDALELTGVVQVGDRSALIVREPNTATSRYIYAGDYLASGQIRVKQIDVSNQEPLVILEYNGREYSRMVGSGPLASLR
ncbi:MAG: hypothetical protein HC812_09000 [Leptolyngbya sp. RL_3_1]|nr:hypothetical protein [Leptolyngbya sp. RL_3_1]